MAAAPAPSPADDLRPRLGTVLVGIAVAAGALLVAALGHRIAAPGADWAGWAAVAVVVAVAVGVAWWTRWDRFVLAGVVGVLVTLAGSGIGRPFVEDLSGTGGGDIVALADVWWPVVVLGLIVVVAAVVGGALAAPTTAAPRRWPGLVALLTEALGLALIAATMGEVVVGQWIEGRPRRRRGRLVRPRATHGGSGVGSEADRGRAGDVWAAAAVDEAEAVHAFAALADRLAAVGAPADLVERAHGAARDEVRHARTCRRLAVTPDGCRPVVVAGEVRDSVPGIAAAPRGTVTAAAASGRVRTRVELIRLAVESYVDGVVGEGAAAGRLEAGAGTAPERAATLRAMAADEREHAALGADVVRWCATASPRLVTPAVCAAARRIPERTDLPARHAALNDAALRAAGLVDRAGADAAWRTERAAALLALDDLLTADTHRA